MQHYWGAQAICDRIGYKCSGRLPLLIRTFHVPAYKRRNPKVPTNLTYYSNEALLIRWELDQAKRFHSQLDGETEAKMLAKQEKQKYGPRGIKK